MEWAITLIGAKADPQHILPKRARVVSSRELGTAKYSALELRVDCDSADARSLRHEIEVAGLPAGLSVAVQGQTTHAVAKRLLVSDIDSTLIQNEMVDEIAAIAGVKDKVAAITARAMAGELDFDASLKERVGLFKGVTLKQLEALRAKLKLTPGAKELVGTLKAHGCKTAMVSGGFTYFATPLQLELEADFLFANELEVQNGKLTGNIVMPILNGAGKRDVLLRLAKEAGIPLEATVALGDGANDIPMLQAAGTSIAFNAKEKTREAAGIALDQPTLVSVLYALGISPSK